MAIYIYMSIFMHMYRNIYIYSNICRYKHISANIWAPIRYVPNRILHIYA